MAPILRDGVFVFCPVSDSLAAAAWPEAVGLFREQEGITLILEVTAAAALNLPLQPRWRMITLSVHSSLEAVGFLAAITQALASAGISVNPVSAFYHDHLFILETQAEAAMAELSKLTDAADGAPVDPTQAEA